MLALLHEIGYIDTDLKQVLPVFRTHYQQYLKEKKVFPHEMGLLLGYPPEDVKGFIHNQGKTICIRVTGKYMTDRMKKSGCFRNMNIPGKN